MNKGQLLLQLDSGKDDLDEIIIFTKNINLLFYLNQKFGLPTVHLDLILIIFPRYILNLKYFTAIITFVLFLMKKDCGHMKRDLNF